SEGGCGVGRTPAGGGPTSNFLHFQVGMGCPRHSNSLLIQLAIHSIGRSRSRKSQAKGERQERCQPQIRTKSASAPYHAVKNRVDVPAIGSSSRDARMMHAISGNTAPANSSGIK